jgi:hypothetical protein
LKQPLKARRRFTGKNPFFGVASHAMQVFDEVRIMRLPVPPPNADLLIWTVRAPAPLIFEHRGIERRRTPLSLIETMVDSGILCALADQGLGWA